MNTGYPISNPILPGFHPDPCLLRVGEDYYMVTSTFEWWPGVRLFHSKDLVHWELKGGILNEKRLADLRGVPDSAGIWAPALSWCDGIFYLVFTVVKSFRHPYKDLDNWLITASSIQGPWSDPVHLNSTGFDPSIFHDADGRSWYLNMVWDPHPDRNSFAGITLQEYDRDARKLVGTASRIFGGSSLGRTEGPHLYKYRDWYFLITAEGGTGWEHAVTVCRSKQITGPYEISPHHPLLSSWQVPDHPLQKAGHGSLVQTENGEWFMAHLCSRPVGNKRRCILGRETALQRIHWTEEDWPVLSGGGCLPALTFEVSGTSGLSRRELFDFKDEFSGSALDPRWNTLREPSGAWLEFPETGGLRLKGRFSSASLFDQSLIGVRVQNLTMDYEVVIDFNPVDFHQSAGLGLYYNTSCHYLLSVVWDESCGRGLQIISCDARNTRRFPVKPVSVATGPIKLKASLQEGKLFFFYRAVWHREWIQIGGELDSTILSDDYPLEVGLDFAFTGAFAVLSVQDASGLKRSADFFSFSARVP